MRIGLCIIVKNESAVIIRMLNSILPIIDHYTVVDTGSADNTKELILEFFDSKGIKGEIYDHPFVNFSDARNFALKLSKDKTDFSFTIDADEFLLMDSGLNIPDLRDQLLKVDIGIVKIVYGDVSYGRFSFYRNSKPFRYFGAAHEILLCDEETESCNINGLQIFVSQDGDSWNGNTKEKFLSHAMLFHDYIEKNGLEPRHVFYLAQSYRDAQEYEKAIQWYKIRTSIQSGFFEERYYSQFSIANLKWTLGKPVQEVADEYMKCNEYDLLRAEHLYNLKLLYERNERSASALQIGEILNKYYGHNPYPQRTLFITPHVYERP